MEADSVHSQAQAVWNGVGTAGKKVDARARTRARFRQRGEEKKKAEEQKPDPQSHLMPYVR